MVGVCGIIRPAAPAAHPRDRGRPVASVHKDGRSSNDSVKFRFAGRQYMKSPETDDGRDAARIEQTLLDIESGRWPCPRTPTSGRSSCPTANRRPVGGGPAGHDQKRGRDAAAGRLPGRPAGRGDPAGRQPRHLPRAELPEDRGEAGVHELGGDRAGAGPPPAAADRGEGVLGPAVPVDRGGRGVHRLGRGRGGAASRCRSSRRSSPPPATRGHG